MILFKLKIINFIKIKDTCICQYRQEHYWMQYAQWFFLYFVTSKVDTISKSFDDSMCYFFCKLVDLKVKKFSENSI